MKEKSNRKNYNQVDSFDTLQSSFDVTYNELVSQARETGWNESQMGLLDHLYECATSYFLESQQLNKKLAATKEYFHSIVDNSRDLIFTTDTKGRVTSVNSVFLSVFGGERSDWIGKYAFQFSTEKRIGLLKKFKRAVQGQATEMEIKLEVLEQDSDVFHLHLIPITVTSKCIGVFFLARNITNQRNLEERMEWLAFYDQSTGLPNRIKFDEILTHAIAVTRKEKLSLSLMFLDIDRFKVINDTIGHDAGDLILNELAHRIKGVLPENVHLGRFSSDKFIILLEKGSTPQHAVKLGNRLLKTIQKPFLHASQEFFVTASIGISLYPFDGSTPTELMKNADSALNQAKSKGGNGIVFYADEMNKQSLQRIEIERSLRRALEQDEFFLAYQPIVDIDSGQINACEALIRWEHPVYGTVNPEQFIPVAEETGLIIPLGRWVLKTACKQLKDWQHIGIGNFSIAVNVSAFQFQNKRFTEDVKGALAYSGLEAKYLQLELTESSMLNKTLDTIRVMKTLRNLGLKISIDDFGTGYSSLSYLKHLPIDKLKIDRSFIQHLSPQSPDFAIVNAVMTIGQGLGLEVVAEGVETKEQLELLSRLRCDFVQGYLIAKPLEAGRFEHWYVKNATLGTETNN